jgi:hypothetical protein
MPSTVGSWGKEAAGAWRGSSLSDRDPGIDELPQWARFSGYAKETRNLE